jgi:hypothetical protein
VLGAAHVSTRQDRSACQIRYRAGDVSKTVLINAIGALADRAVRQAAVATVGLWLGVRARVQDVARSDPHTSSGQCNIPSEYATAGTRSWARK